MSRDFITGPAIVHDQGEGHDIWEHDDPLPGDAFEQYIGSDFHAGHL